MLLGFANDNYTIEEMIRLCKNSTGLSGPITIFKLENLSQDDFDALFGHIEEVDVNLEMVASSAKQLNFRNMKVFRGTFGNV